MLRRTPQPTFFFIVSICVAGFTLSGCTKSDLSGYQKAGQNRKSSNTTVEKAIDPPTTADTTSSPDKEELSIVAIEALPDPTEFDILPVSAIAPVNVVDGADVRALMSVVKQEPKELATTGKVTDEQAAQPHKVELLIKEKSFRRDSRTDSLQVSFDDLDLLKVLNMEPVTEDADKLMPDWLLGLNGKRVRVRGFMYPTYETEGIEKFVLARDNQICCFGRDPKVYDLVQVNMKSGKTTSYIPPIRAFDVVGTFQINMMAEEGKPYGLYFIDQAEVLSR